MSAAVRTVMRGAITLTGERIHSSNYVAPTNFCPSTNLRNSRRRICARGGLLGVGARGDERGTAAAPGWGLRLTISPVPAFSRSQAVADIHVLVEYIGRVYTCAVRYIHGGCRILYKVTRRKLGSKSVFLRGLEQSLRKCYMED